MAGKTGVVSKSLRSGKERSMSNSDASSSSTIESASSHHKKIGFPVTDSCVIYETRLPPDVESSLVNKIQTMLQEVESRLAATFYDALDSLKSRVTHLEKEVEKLQLEKTQLEGENESLQRLARLPDAVIRGVPYVEGENLVDIIKEISHKIGHILSPHFDAFRIGKIPYSMSNNGVSGGRSTIGAPIVVRFSCVNERRAFISSFKRLGRYRLNQISGFSSDSLIYVNESLSTKNNAILREALKLRKANRLSTVYTSGGLVHVKVKQGERSVKLSCLHQLYHLCETVMEKNSAAA